MPDSRPRLLVMRLTDMVVLHPNQTTKTCHLCGEAVGVYPSGQAILRKHPDAEIVCSRCHRPSAEFDPEPAARSEEEFIAEVMDSMRRQ